MLLKAKDLRRLWIVLGAMEYLQPATLTTLHNDLGWSVSTIQRLIERLNSDQLPGVVVSNAEDHLKIENWGILVNQSSSLDIYFDYKESVSGTTTNLITTEK